MTVRVELERHHSLAQEYHVLQGQRRLGIRHVGGYGHVLDEPMDVAGANEVRADVVEVQIRRQRVVGAMAPIRAADAVQRDDLPQHRGRGLQVGVDAVLEDGLRNREEPTQGRCREGLPARRRPPSEVGAPHVPSEVARWHPHMGWRRRVAQRPAFGVDQCQAALDLRQPRALGEHLDHARRDGRLEHVVGVQEDDDVTRAPVEPGVAGRSLAAVLLQNDCHLVAVALDDVPRLVRRAVVDDDHLALRVRLRQGAVDRLRQIAPVVVVVDDDADEQGDAHSPPNWRRDVLCAPGPESWRWALWNSAWRAATLAGSERGGLMNCRPRQPQCLSLMGSLLSSTAAWLALCQGAYAQTLPPDFREDTIFSGLTQPTAIAFAADGRVFVGEKRGLIKVFTSLQDTTPDVVADLRSDVHDFWDRGLLGMALDPNFPTKNVIYVLYTYDAPIGGSAPVFNDACSDPNGNGCVVSGRLARLTNIGTDPSTVNQQVLINDWCQQYPSHSIGSLAFGPDGALYVSGGDGASFNGVDYGQAGSPLNPCGDPPGGVGGAMSPPTAEGGALRSQDMRTPADPTSLDGAILRLNPDTGAAMPDNPLVSSADPNARRIIAYGLRNPFRMTFRPGTNELWVGDVGWNDWEEIDRVTDVGAPVENFGWPCYEGDKQGSARQAGYDAANLTVCENLYAQAGAVVAPYFSYKHSDQVIVNEACPQGGSSIAGLAFQFYTGGPYPPEYDGALFFADYSRNCIWAMQRAGNQLPSPSNIKSFVGGAGSPVQLVMSPGGELFYVDISGGTVRRIRYTAPPPNTEDKALNHTATASSTYAAGYEPAKAVDSNLTTRWSSTFSDGQWWQVDLGSARQVSSVRVNWETAYASQYTISTSTDGTTFSPAATVNITQAGVETTTFAARSARYVPVTGVARATAWGV